MRVTFRNLGTIKKTELDVRPMTVIIGPNNTSKTYVAYSVYGLLKWASASRGPLPFGLRRAREHLWMSFDELSGAIANTLNVSARQFARELTGFFQDTSGRVFAGTRLAVAIGAEEIRRAIRDDKERDVEIGFDGDLIKIEASSFGQRATNVDMFVGRYMQTLLLPQPFLLPVERNAFIITYKLLANRRFKLLRDQQRDLLARAALSPNQLELFREYGHLRYPAPIEDFLDFLIDIELRLSGLDATKSSPFRALASDIESKIQGNNKTVLVPTALGGKEIKVDVRDDLRIDLYNASSSIKQLAPLLLYLRYQAAPNQLLIIDEPEMNLHPEGQAKLLEALAILVNLGVHVLITTHSPYFMAHLNNLVAGDTKRPAVRKRQAQSLYMADPRAFLSMDQVSAYEMKDNQLCSLKDDAYGIRWDTLSDVSVELQQRFFAIQEAGQARRGKKK